MTLTNHLPTVPTSVRQTTRSHRAGKHCLQNKKTMCLNLSAPFIVQFFGAQLGEVMPYVDILFGNDDEAKEYAKGNNFNTEVALRLPVIFLPSYFVPYIGYRGVPAVTCVKTRIDAHTTASLIEVAATAGRNSGTT